MDFEQYFKEWEAKIGAFLEYKPVELEGRVPFAVKDNIAVRGFSLTCASRLLEGLRSPYTATAVRRLEEAGFAVTGKTNMDEFGMGSSTDLSALGTTNNPWNTALVSGGSSGGSAAAVAAGLVPFALGTDTGGSVRQPAAFCGVAGLKPTWGAVSRFGLVAYASSLETIGILADGIERCRTVFNIIKGADPADQCSVDAAPPRVCQTQRGGKVIGVLPPESVAAALSAGAKGTAAHEAAAAAALSPAIARAFETAKSNLTALGWKLVNVEVPALQWAVPAYYTIAAAEASANLARFDGIRYGKRPVSAENPSDLTGKARTAGFGQEVKLRILLGTFVLRSGFQDQFYNRAQKIRAAIRHEFEKELEKCSALLMPVFPTQAFGRGGDGLSPFAQKAADIWTCCANLAGLPALSFPASLEDGLPAGVQLMGARFSEDALLDIAASYEAAHPFPRPQGWQQFFK